MIKAENIEKSYGYLKVLKGINLQIEPGRIVSLYGTSGSGKTTLLNILGTLDNADGGSIQIGEMKRYFGHEQFVKANKFQRCLNYIIDSFIILVICLLIGVLTWLIYYFLFAGRNSGFVLPDWASILGMIILIIIPFAVFCLYYLLLESNSHVTLGKLLTNTLVIKEDGLYPSTSSILYRTFARLIPFDPVSLLLSSKKNSWHDKISQTIVIDRNINSGFLKELTHSKVRSEKDLCSFRNQSIGFIFQFHNLLPEFTALENVCLPGYIKDGDETAVEKRAKELLSTLGLADKFSNFPSELSGGELQRVAVARALINNPQIVLADEPSGNLDSKNAEYLHQLFVRLRDKFGFTFFIATHNKHLAEISDSVLHIRDGKIYEIQNQPNP